MSMSKFEQLTKYIDALDGDGFGTWIVDHENLNRKSKADIHKRKNEVAHS